MLWILSDGTEIQVEDDSTGMAIFKTIETRNDVWDMIDLISEKDTSSFVLQHNGNSREYPGRVFDGITIEKKPGIMEIRFMAESAKELFRLERENQILTERATTYQDKANAYDILVNGQTQNTEI